MIKYADRGLVRRGTVSKLFEYLYMVSIGFWMIWIYSIIIIDYLKYESVTEVRHVITKLCLNIENHSTNKQNSTFLTYFFELGFSVPSNYFEWS